MPTKTAKPSPTQQAVIDRLSAGNGEIYRMRGGFWTTKGTPMKDFETPEWSVSILTIRAMERLGLLERTYAYTEEWHDTRRLVKT